MKRAVVALLLAGALALLPAASASAAVGVDSAAFADAGIRLYAQGTLTGLDPTKQHYLWLLAAGRSTVHCSPSGVEPGGVNTDEVSNSNLLGTGVSSFSTRVEVQSLSPEQAGCPAGDTSVTMLDTNYLLAVIEVKDYNTLAEVGKFCWERTTSAWYTISCEGL